MAPAVVLVGAPGSGKTTVGRIVAGRLAMGFRDTDADVEQASGASITEIFVDEGETGFRRRERAAVVAALAEHDGVLALGGGAVEDPDTRSDLRGLTVVWLTVGPAEAAKRTGIGGPRPLAVGNVRTALLTRLRKREPRYREVAGHEVSTDGVDPADVAERVVGLLNGGVPA
jgi:shikimate kinase